jgi:drug/metabolite transporter (DMT)-like permease|tara:strand:+ start:993 stop:1961 length:969 start_codon:yes stop_codon:yes gene_type:complete
MADSTQTVSVGDGGGVRLTAVILAFAAIYVIWGSTYLAIRFAIETMPPFGMAAVRFLVAGALMYVWLRARGGLAPTLVQWRSGAISGTLLLVGGNGAVVVAEQWVPSGLVALIVATVPMWMVLLDAQYGSGNRPSGRALIGLMLGFLGVGVLAGSPGVGAGGRQEFLGASLVLVGSICWAIGSLVSRYMENPPRPAMLVSTQMLSGGAIFTLLSLASGELAGFSLLDVSPRSWWALLYLIIAGAIVGYAAYVWLLTVVLPSRVATYAYVNPVVALFLGWALAGEPLTPRSMLAAAIILASVVVITADPVQDLRVKPSDRADV